MSRAKLIKRVACQICDLPIEEIRPYHERAVLEQMTKLWIDDRPRNLASFLTLCDSFRLAHPNMAAVFCDHIGLLAGDTSNYDEISRASKGLLDGCKRWDVPVVALCQLSRRVEQRTPPVPVLSDLRESGHLEQDADNAFMLFRPAYYDGTADPAEAHLYGRKVRDGTQNAKLLLTWASHCAKFYDRSPGDPPPLEPDDYFQPTIPDFPEEVNPLL